MKWLLYLLLSPGILFSEYRVYKLKITDTKKKKSRIVHSTLDWIQYRDYNHIKIHENIILVDHWMCWKRSDGLKPLCKRPVTSETLKSESDEQ